MNHAFRTVLAQAGHAIPEYKPLHSDLLWNSRRKQLVAAPAEVLAMCQNISAAYVRVVETRQTTGVVFLDIFKDSHCPLHRNNIAMLYTVGPKREDYKQDKTFLDSVHAMAENIAAACAGV